MKGKLLAFGLALMATATIGIVQLQAKATDNSRDCDQYAVIRCGTMTASELRAEYDTNNGSPMNGDTTKQPDIRKVFSGMGISATDLDGSFKSGTVYRDGTVKVDGKVVATNAKMAARHLGGTPIAGTDAAKISVSAMASAQTALVKFDQNDKFLFAVMKPCGNAVTATPKVTTHETPPPTPPTPPTPSTPGIDVVKYVGNDSKYQRVGVNVEFSYRIDVKNTGNVDLDNVLVTDTPDRAITLISVSPPSGKIENNTFVYTIPKLLKGETRTFTLTAKVPAYMAGRLINTVCVDTPTIPGSPDKCDKAEVDVPPKTEQPPAPVLPRTPTELPETGPANIIMQIVGAMSLVGASAYYVTSRRTA